MILAGDITTVKLNASFAYREQFLSGVKTVVIILLIVRCFINILRSLLILNKSLYPAFIMTINAPPDSF